MAGRRRSSPDTRAALIAAARRLFVANGYAATSTEDVVAASGAGTRGALYHHFAGKRALFRAVFLAVEERLVEEARARGYRGNSIERLRGGLVGFLDAALDPEVQQIILIDGPAVLGWDEWREIEARYGLGAIERLLQAAIGEGLLDDQPTAVLAHVLLAAVDEAALYVANASHPAEARESAVGVVDRLLEGLRKQGAQ
jgi:AcrR family transcriptional regulator